jgi:hypothetical protein
MASVRDRYLKDLFGAGTATKTPPISGIGSADELVNAAGLNYKFVKNNDFDTVYSTDTGKDYRYLETYPPDEPGAPHDPRPIDQLPMGRYGIEIFNRNVSPLDLAGDVFSHIDPAGQRYGHELEKTINERQLGKLKDNYNAYDNTMAQKNVLNKEEKARLNSVSALLRTTALGQDEDKMTEDLLDYKFNVEQQNILNNAKNYVKSGVDNGSNLSSARAYLGLPN